ncbi:MAG: AraC family transcriptional regulator, partial [Flavobacteriaceae bacterium]
MKLDYFESSCPSLIEEFYRLSLSSEDLTFKSTLMPQGVLHLTYNFGKRQKAVINDREFQLKGLMLTGQFMHSYQFIADCTGTSLGLSLHPTALHKMTNMDISQLENGHHRLKDINKELYERLNPLFEQYGLDGDMEWLIKKIDSLLKSHGLTVNKQTKYIDKAIDMIREKEGMLNIEDLLQITNVSQKTLETQFKKIVGLTPGKYIRLIRFLHLMKKYESDEISIKDLIYMYDYYDHSHFTKDFKMYMHETPRSYFKKDYPLVREILM